MPSLVPGYEYDIFISYRQNDNRTGWVTEFVKALQEELAATIKDPVSVYFDINPLDGLLETHHVDKSLEGKLKCLIFIPIISQTYCDPKSFAWQNEFCVFNKLAKEDLYGRDIRLGGGNVSSRILPVKIHDLDPADKSLLESELGGVLRALELIYKEPGVNRPLKPTDHKIDNQNKTDYRNQVNKVANAVKEIIQAFVHPPMNEHPNAQPKVLRRKKTKLALPLSLALIAVIVAAFLYFGQSESETPLNNKDSEMLDRAEKYFEEYNRFNDKRYKHTAMETLRKVLAKDSTNERALFMIAGVTDSPEYYMDKIQRVNNESIYAMMLHAGILIGKGDVVNSKAYLKSAERLNPKNKYVLDMLSNFNLTSGNYLEAWEYVEKYRKVEGEDLHEVKSSLFLELGDFKKARGHLELKLKEKEFSCNDLEFYQRIFLCEGNFERLETVTDSICDFSKCEQCPYWKLRAKMHTGKYNEAARYTGQGLKVASKMTWRTTAFVLLKVGKKDSARLLNEAEVKYNRERLADSVSRQGIAMYSQSAIYAMQGNSKESMKWLRQYQDHGFEFGSEWYIGHDPLFDEVLKEKNYLLDFMQIIQKAQAKKTAILEKIKELEKQQAP